MSLSGDGNPNLTRSVHNEMRLRFDAGDNRISISVTAQIGKLMNSEKRPDTSGGQREVETARLLRTRTTFAILFVVIGAVVASAAMPSMWARRTVLDTDRWVETVAPLSEDPAIQDSVSDAMSDALLSGVDVGGYVGDALPEQLGLLEPVITGAFERLVRDGVDEAVRSERFAEAWRNLNQKGHSAFLRATDGKPGVVEIEGGEFVVDTGELSDGIRDRLDGRAERLLSLAPSSGEGRRIVLFRSRSLELITNATLVLSRGAIGLVAGAVAFFALAVAVAPDRRKILMWLGIGLLLAALVPLQALAASKSVAVSSAGRWSPAVDAVFGTVTTDLVAILRSTALAGLLLWLGAFAAGPSWLGRAVRSGFGRATEGVAGQWDAGPVGTWVAEHRSALQGIALLLGALVLLPAPLRTSQLVWWVAVTEALVLGGIAVIARAVRPHPPDDEAS